MPLSVVEHQIALTGFFVVVGEGLDQSDEGVVLAWFLEGDS